MSFVSLPVNNRLLVGLSHKVLEPGTQKTQRNAFPFGPLSWNVLPVWTWSTFYGALAGMFVMQVP